MNEFSPDVTYRDVPEYPGYRAGTDGSVWSCWRKGPNTILTNNWRKLVQSVGDKMGYLSVTLCRLGKREFHMVHTIILKTFVGPRPLGMVARHFPDRDPTNCALSNLMWGTHEENMADRHRDGNDQLGEKNVNAKITEADVRVIRAANYFGAVSDMAKCFGLSTTSIIAIRKRRTWKHVF